MVTTQCSVPFTKVYSVVATRSIGTQFVDIHLHHDTSLFRKHCMAPKHIQLGSGDWVDTHI